MGTRTRTVTIVVTAAIALVACGSDDSADNSSPPAPSASESSAAESSAPAGSTGGAPDTGAGDDAMAAVVEGAQWSDGVDISYGDGTITYVSDGVPNHARQDQYLVPVAGVTVPTDGSEAQVVDDPTVAQDYNFEITSSPTYSEETTQTNLGPIGLMISGAALFNPYEADDSTTALDGNFDVNGVLFVDGCSGHPTPMGLYHYHGVPYCITDVLDEEGKHSFIIGIVFDGFGVYGPQGADGDAPTDLDECNGHFGPTPDSPEGIYHYHLTETDPYSLRCYHGEIDTSQFQPGPPG